MDVLISANEAILSIVKAVGNKDKECAKNSAEILERIVKNFQMGKNDECEPKKITI